MIDMSKFKTGDKVKITRLSWDRQELIGRVGEIVYVDKNEKTYCIYFKGWYRGHDATGDRNLKYGKKSSWCLYHPDRNLGDDFVKIGKVGQLEFDFEKKEVI